MSRTCHTCGLGLNTPDNGNVKNVPLCIDCKKRNNGSSSIGAHLNSSDVMAGSSPHIKLETRNDETDRLDASSRGEEIDNHHNLAPNDSDMVENAAGNAIPFFLSDEENNSHWMLPEPEYPEQDRYSVAYNDDGDDYTDGTSWRQSSSLSVDEDPGNHHTRKKALQEAMMLVKNGEFSNIVYQHLDNVMGQANNETVMKWLGIVTSLSWDAAMLIKPEADVAMDPGSYLKVKCVASGSRSDSQVVKGLVFNKKTAHKHMPTNLTNPSILLIQGSLHYSADGLSSLASVKEEDDYNKKIITKIESCHWKVVLVQKTAAFHMLRPLSEKGIAVAVDMKLPRLERIAQCLDSCIISSADILASPQPSKIARCHSFLIKKFEEDLECVGADGRKPSKTLMFLEGCPRPLGCTILLRGANRDELKNVKGVVQDLVSAAYHLIARTSFFEDQRTFFSDMNATYSPASSSIDGVTPIDIPISDGLAESSVHIETQSNLDVETIQVQNVEQALVPSKLVSSISASVQKSVLVPLATDSISSHCDVNENDQIKEEESNAGISTRESTDIKSGDRGTIDQGGEKIVNEVKIESKDEAVSAVDPKKILVTRSTYCIPTKSACNPRQLVPINYYGYMDDFLEWYLQDILNKNCALCNRPPEHHVYRYTHKNGSLTVRVRSLKEESPLSGKSEGKIWMWIRCLKCQDESRTGKSSKRVVMSSSACGLSFGKFLQLSFRPSKSSKLSRCGHLLHQDCLRYFGLGSKIAMFRYTSIEPFTPCRPPLVLEFCNPSEQEWIAREARDIISKGDIFFTEVANLLKELKSKFSTTLLKHSMEVSGLVLKFDGVEEMLMLDKTEFQAPLMKYTAHMGNNDQQIFDTNWLMHELHLLLYIWDTRFNSIYQHWRGGDKSDKENDVIGSSKKLEKSIIKDGNQVREIPIQSSSDVKEIAPYSSDQAEKDTSKVETGQAEVLDNITDSKENSQKHEISTDLGPGNDKLCSDSRIGGNDSQKYEDLGGKDPKRWIWAPFSASRKAFRKDLQGGFLYKYEFINTYRPTHLSPMHQLDTRMRNSSLFFPIGPGSRVISVIEDEISSIIACALTVAIDNSHNLTSTDESPEIPFYAGKFLTKSKWSVVCVYAKQFFSLRKKCRLPEIDYISSLSRCKKWDAQGGKSKVFFAKTMDDRFIIKQIKKIELDYFSEFGPRYFKHINGSLDSGSQTCLAKILGVYKVKQTIDGKEVKTDLVVMENLFFGRNISRKYDLKGAVFNRYISNSNDPESVLQDENFAEDMCSSPIYVRGKDKQVLERAIWNDTYFLSSVNVMDYSLIVGVDKQKREIVYGIIDYLRLYTLDKYAESFYKTYVVVPKRATPTVISPEEYKKRFRKFIATNILSVWDTRCFQKSA